MSGLATLLMLSFAAPTFAKPTRVAPASRSAPARPAPALTAQPAPAPTVSVEASDGPQADVLTTRVPEEPATAPATTALPAASPPAPSPPELPLTTASATTAPSTTAQPTADHPKTETAGERQTALAAAVTLKVMNVTLTSAEILKQVQALGGFPVTVTESALKFKVPPPQLATLMSKLPDYGIVLEKTLQREDLTLHLAQLAGVLKSKGEILEKLKGFFDDSDVDATLNIETSMTKLVSELEAVKGQQRVLRDRADWAVLRLSFSFRQRDRVIDAESRFDWLNTVTLQRFLGEF